ncbi:MAG: hypothetical protein ACK2UM_02395 [Anaerolineales bacterium]
MTATVRLTAISSFIGFLLNMTILYLVLARGRKTYHYLFAGVLFICAVWDLGITLAMLRNGHPGELISLGYLVSIPCTLLVPLVFHFTCSYLNCPRTKTTIILWVMTGVMVILLSLGFLFRQPAILPLGRIIGVYEYSWGNIWKGDENWRNSLLFAIPSYYIVFLVVCWFLFNRLRQETSPVVRRHLIYILVGFLAIGFAGTKIFAVVGVDWPILLPAGMALNDIFAGLIGIAIIKERLFDITVVLEKGALYSVLGAGFIFIFSFSEHMLATYVGEVLGENSYVIHLISIAVVIAVLMPVKHWLERKLNYFFQARQIEF